MPATSKAQRRLMAIAEHHPEKVYAKNKGVLDMSKSQLHDFAASKEKGKPEHVKSARRVGGTALGSGSHGFRTHKK